MINEMRKLRDYLDAKGIKWQDKSEWCIIRTHFTINGSLWSAINGMGTYGGYLYDGEKNQGLLELMIGNNDPTGWMTADDVIALIEE